MEKIMKKRVTAGTVKKSGQLGAKFKKNISAWCILLPSVILMCYIVWRPIFISLYYSLFKMQGYNLVEFVGLKNYVDVLTDSLFLKTLWNTVKYVLLSAVIGFPLPIILAVMLNEIVHMKGFFKISLYIPAIIPGIAVSMIWYYMYFPDPSGFLNMVRSFFGLEPAAWLQDGRYTILYIVISMTWQGMGGTMIMYLAGLSGINQDLYEASKIDGAGFFRKIWHVTIPQMRSIFILMAARQVISVFQVMEQPLAMTGGGPDNESITLALQTYQYAFDQFQMSKALSLSTVTFLLLMVFTIGYFWLEKKLDD